MNHRFLLQSIGLFLLLRFGITLSEGQRKCVSNVCFNGGSCIVEERGGDEPPVFECLCPDGFAGTLCEETLQTTTTIKPSSCQQSGCNENEICLFDVSKNDFQCQENKCANKPCKNNVTCRPIPGDYICECGKGLLGRNCEEDLDECEDEPCLNNGECVNKIGTYECVCKPGFSGKICEQRSGFCVQKPCGHHGVCKELENNFECSCDEGWYGRLCDRMTPIMSCEKPRILIENEDGVGKCVCPMGTNENGKNCENSIEECLVDGQKCKNDAICAKDADGTPFCKCQSDKFDGKWCENQIEQSNKTLLTCSPNPCQNNGVCSTDNGYVQCTCDDSHTGDFCELKCQCPSNTVCRENLMKKGQVECLRVEPIVSPLETNNDEINNKPSPTSFSFVDLPLISSFDVANISSCDDCFNAQKCIFADRRLMCLCGSNFGGPLCSERANNTCSGIKCSGNQICKKRRTSFGDTPYCSCPEGTFGPNCQRKLPPATFGPNSVAVIQAPTPPEDEKSFSLEFTFRTTVTNLHLASGESILNDLEFLIELQDGYLVMQLGEQKITNLVELRLNDADWYTVVISSSSSDDMNLLFELHDSESGFVLAHKQLGHHQFNVFTVRFGRRKQNSFFTGCLREIRINKTPIDVFTKDRSVNIQQGCKFEPHCKTDSCGHGVCVELWNSFQCICRRPYLPPNCLHELQEATFGKDNLTSIVSYSVQPEVSNSLSSNTEFSFLLRTNKPDAQIMYIGQSGDDDTATFISCGLRNGTLAMDSRLGGKAIQQSRGRRRIDDNSPHLIEVKRKDNNLTMYIDGSKEGNMLIMRPFSHPLIVDRIILGTENSQSNQSDLFKGTLQDVRVNDLNLLVSETTPDFIKQNQTIGTQLMRQNLFMGTVSDDLCGIKKPCQHGNCENTFNDYLCSCDKGFMGKNCELIDYCSNSPCPTEAQCINTHGGFICKSPATFAKTSQVKFLLKQANNNDSTGLRFSFAIRTRTPSAQVFKINTISESLWMELKDETVVFHYVNQTNTIDDPLSVNLSNGQWHSVELSENDDGLSVTFDNSTVPLLNRFSLKDFLDGNDSWLTFGRSQNASGFKGCLHNVRFGSLPDLSFYALVESGTFSLNNTKHFEMKIQQNVLSDGCHSKDLCGPINPCRNNALCRDLFNLRKCDCGPGFEGDLCEINVDECVDNKDCGSNGKCIDGINSFSCACKAGYSGPLCSNELDQCTSNPCKNEGNCKTINGQAICSCKDSFIGKTCKVKRNAKCRDKPCVANNTLSCVDTENGPQCECNNGFHGELCEESIAEEMCADLPCKNGGICAPTSDGSIKCQCPANYEGEFCEKLKNNCKKGKCNHGVCRSIFGGHLCECNEGWDGPDCSSDINECLDFPCTNNGTCTNKSPGYECSCPEFYLGKDCEIAGICSRSPCRNGKCIQRSATEYRCECDTGYTGKNCETEIDYCVDEPCLNGASCQRLIGSFMCHCVAGFTGKTCETNIDDCENNTDCKHGGKCIDRVNGFDCDCLGTGYQGMLCDVDINECLLEEKCLNGTCKNLAGSYECSCQSGYVGLSCNMVDPCVPDSKNRTLHNCVHGNCVNPRVVKQPSGRDVVEYDCSCWEHYTGQFCSHVEQTRKQISIGYVLGPGIALLIVSILLVCMLFFFVARNRRANQGTYSPSTHEMNGTARVQMHTLQTPMKKQERLI